MSADTTKFAAIMGAIEALMDQVEQVGAESRKMVELYDNQLLGLEDIAERMGGISITALKHSPWKLPNFGRPDVIGKNGRHLWRAGAVRAMMEIPEEERRRRWDLMKPAERREAIGIAS